MNKIQQIFGLDPEYNKKMEEQARQLHEKALAGTTIRNSAWADRIRERFMRVV